jgi:hypothetical protein
VMWKGTRSKRKRINVSPKKGNENERNDNLGGRRSRVTAPASAMLMTWHALVSLGKAPVIRVTRSTTVNFRVPAPHPDGYLSLRSIWTFCFTSTNILVYLYYSFIRTSHESGYNQQLTALYRVSQEKCAKLRESVPYVKVLRYTECPRRNVPNIGRVFLMLKYTDIQSVPGEMCQTSGECSLC